MIGATHGDEPIGPSVLRRLERRNQGFDWVVGNPKAFERRTRGYEGDLNRSAPGDRSSSRYAKRRAAEIIRISKGYRYVIDLHGSSKNTGIFIIITNPTEENLRFASMFAIQRIVIWSSFSPELSGPLSEYFSCGLEIECGPKESGSVVNELESVLEEFLCRRKEYDGERSLSSLLESKIIYEVYGSFKESVPEETLQEFSPTSFRGEVFCPLLVGSYSRNGITCYKMRRIKDISGLCQDT